jgi:hypothetical protein
MELPRKLKSELKMTIRAIIRDAIETDAVWETVATTLPPQTQTGPELERAVSEYITRLALRF